MDFLINLFTKTLLEVWTSFLHNWPFLLMSILIAVILKLYIDPAKVSAFLLRHRKIGVIGATAAAVGTPLCSCGTTAILLGMMAGSLPWAPIIAFMVASPLTSPEGLIYSAGLFGWPFAIAFFAASIVLGLVGGLAGGILENRGWLKGQARFAAAGPTSQPLALAPAACGCDARPAPVASSSSASPRRVMALSNIRPPTRQFALQPAACCAEPAALSLESSSTAAGSCSCSPAPTIATLQPSASGSCACAAQPAAPAPASPAILKRFVDEAFTITTRLIPMFFGFAFIGYFLNGLIPAAWVSAIFGSGNIYSVPLAATLGLPLYINSEASLPLVRALIEGGMSQGAALAFLVTGAGTSVGAVTGALTIARWRVIALVVAILWVGAIGLGYVYNLLLATGLV